MTTFIPTDKFERWWRKAQAWFATQFASINIDTSDLATKNLEQFFDITSSTSYTAATNTEILDECEAIWLAVTGDAAPSVTINGYTRVHDNNTNRTFFVVASNGEEIG